MQRIATSFLFFLLLSSTLHAEVDACECDREALFENVRSAQTIFYGSIQEASMASANSDTIQLTLEVSEQVRGVESGPVRVSTTLPHQCGVPATLGMHWLIVVPNNDEPVTRCGGSGFHSYPEGHELYDLHNLVFAIHVVEFVDSDPKIVRSWLKRIYSPGHSKREEMEGLFSLIGELDTESLITVTDNEVSYRSMVFVFNDDVLVDYLWKDGS